MIYCTWWQVIEAVCTYQCAKIDDHYFTSEEIMMGRSYIRIFNGR